MLFAVAVSLFLFRYSRESDSTARGGTRGNVRSSSQEKRKAISYTACALVSFFCDWLLIVSKIYKYIYIPLDMRFVGGECSP